MVQNVGDPLGETYLYVELEVWFESILSINTSIFMTAINTLNISRPWLIV